MAVSDVESAPGLGVIELVCSIWDGTLQWQRLRLGLSAGSWQGCRRYNSESIRTPKCYVSLSLLPHLPSECAGNAGLSAVFISNTPLHVWVSHTILRIASEPRKIDSSIIPFTQLMVTSVPKIVNPMLIVVVMIALFAVKQDHRKQDRYTVK